MPTTIELFRDDANLTTCDAVVTAVDGNAVQLDRTVFYPQGGGQAGDTGVLVTVDGRQLQVVDTRKGAEPGQVLHLLADTAPAAETAAAIGLAVGQSVTARIDVARREAHRRFHTSTHLLCALVPHPVDGCSITASYARLDFHMTEPLDKDELTAGLARLVAEAHPVSTRWVTDAELDANPQWVRSMRVTPPRGNGLVRLVDVQGVDMQPCGGTHVNNTADIGPVVVTKIEKKSANTRRVVLGFGG